MVALKKPRNRAAPIVCSTCHHSAWGSYCYHPLWGQWLGPIVSDFFSTGFSSVPQIHANLD